VVFEIDRGEELQYRVTRIETASSPSMPAIRLRDYPGFSEMRRYKR
jgi:hypothetical protein